MKKIILLLALLAPAAALAAGGPADGIYNCTISSSLLSDPFFDKQAYMVISGQPTGQSIYTWAATDWSVNAYGYGIGTISGVKFSGMTNNAGAFTFSLNNGNISGLLPSDSVAHSAQNFTCSKIW